MGERRRLREATVQKRSTIASVRSAWAHRRDGCPSKGGGGEGAGLQWALNRSNRDLGEFITRVSELGILDPHQRFSWNLSLLARCYNVLKGACWFIYGLRVDHICNIIAAKTIPLGSSAPVLGMKVKHGKDVIWLFLKIPLWITISMKSSRRDLSIDMVIQRGIFKNNQITLLPPFYLNTLNSDSFILWFL